MSSRSLEHRIRKEYSRSNAIKPKIVNLILVCLVLSMLLLSAGYVFFYMGRSLTGMVTYEQNEYLIEVGQLFENNTTYSFVPQKNGRLLMIELTGSFNSSSIIRIGENILLNSTLLGPNYTIEDDFETAGDINLSYITSDCLDCGPNASIGDAIGFSIKRNGFNFSDENLCTLWTIYSYDTSFSNISCNGNNDCCNLSNLTSSGEWNDTYYLNYGQDGATYRNRVSAVLVSVNYSAEEDNFSINYSSNVSLKAVFIAHEIPFTDYCLDCSLDIDEENFTLYIESGSIMISSLKYIVEEEIITPQEDNITLQQENNTLPEDNIALQEENNISGANVTHDIVQDANEKSSYTQERIILADVTAPGILLNAPVDYYKSNVSSINFNWTASDDNGTTCNLSINLVVKQNNISVVSGQPYNITISGLGEGIHNWSVTCYDTFNNTRDSNTYKFVIDTSKPGISFGNSTTPAGLDTDDHIFASVNASDSNYISTFIDLDSSLISWWRMDETNGSHVFDYLGKYNGTLVGATETEGGYHGKGVTLDGYNDYINFSDSVELNLTDKITIAAWVKPYYNVYAESNSSYGWMKIVGKRAWPGVPHNAWILEFVETTLKPEFSMVTTDTGGIQSRAIAGGEISEGNWHHIVGTYDGESQNLYVDGNLNISIETTGYIVNDFVWPIEIGAHKGLTGWLNATIDDVMLFNRTLSADEVSALYATSSTRLLERNFTSLVDGNYTIKAFVQDMAGNINYTEQRNISVQAEPPDITLNSPLDNAVSNTSMITFNWTAVSIRDITCNLTINDIVNRSDIAVTSAVPYNITVDNFSDDRYYWEVTCWDELNNTASSENRLIINGLVIPEMVFEPTTTSSGTHYRKSLDINVSATASSNLSTFIDFDRSTIGWWRFENGSIDHLGNYNGISYANSSLTDNGYLGKGMSFDGDGDYISIQNTSTINLSGDVTVSLWVRLNTTTPATQDIIGKWNGTDGFRLTYESDDGFNFYTGETSSSSSYSGAKSAGIWYHIVGRYDGSKNNIFVNGIKGTSPATSYSNGYSGSNITIGKLGLNDSNYLNGTLDDILIFNRSLSDEEVARLYANSSVINLRRTFENLDNKNYSFKAYTQDSSGRINTTEERTVRIETYPLWFITPASLPLSQSGSSIDVYVGAVADENISLFLDYGSSLVGWWRFDEGNGTVDYTGRNNGTIVGEANQTADGYLGKGMVFDGGGGYINVGADDSLDITGEITIAAWVYVNSSSSDQTIVSKTAGNGSENNPYEFRINQDRKLVIARADNIDSGKAGLGIAEEKESGGDQNITLNRWYHVAVTVASNLDVYMYIDGIGQDAGVFGGDGRSPTGNSNPVLIGNRDDNATPFNGTIDDVMIFNRVLSPDEIALLYTNTSTKYLEKTVDSLQYGSNTITAYTQGISGNVTSADQIITRTAPATSSSSDSTGGSGGSLDVIDKPSPTPDKAKQPISSSHTPIDRLSPIDNETTVEEGLIRKVLFDNKLQYNRDIRYTNSNTVIIDTIKNVGLFGERDIKINLDFPKSVLFSADMIVSESEYDIIRMDPIVEFNMGSLGSHESRAVSYSIPGRFTIEELSAINTTITKHIKTAEELAEEQLQLENTLRRTNDALDIKTSIKTDAEANETRFEIELNLKENTTRLSNVSIIMEIPKCLIAYLKDIDIKDTNLRLEIQNADPIIVWYIDNVLQQEKILFSLKAIADEDCANQAKVIAVARDILFLEEEIDYRNVAYAILFAIFIFGVLLLFSSLTSQIEHEDKTVAKLIRIAKKLHHIGYDKKSIENKFKEEGYDQKTIDESLSLNAKNKLHYWIIRFGITGEEFIFICLALLHILNFLGLLPGDLDYAKKIISWTLMALIFFHVSITRVLFGFRWKILGKINADILIMAAFFSILIKQIIAIARTGAEPRSIVFDLYNLLIKNSLLLERAGFIIGISSIFIISLIIAARKDIEKPSFVSVFGFIGKSTSFGSFILRLVSFNLFFLFFYYIVFEKMTEWLAIAVDAPLFILSLPFALYFIFKHRYKMKKRFSEVGKFLDKYYENFIELFHYRKTVILGVIGLLLLHLLTEILIFIIPYLTSIYDPIYFGNFNEYHKPLFFADSLLKESLAGIGSSFGSALGVYYTYIFNVLGFISIAVILGYLWYWLASNKDIPFTKFSDTIVEHKLSKVLPFMMAAITVFILNPCFKIIVLSAESIIGADIQTRSISISLLYPVIIASIMTGLITYLLLKWVKRFTIRMIFSASVLFFLYYIYIYYTSIYYYFMEAMLTGNLILTIYFWIFNGLSALFYIGGSILFVLLAIGAIWKIRIPFFEGIFHLNMYSIHHHETHEGYLHGEKLDSLVENIIKNTAEGHELFIITSHFLHHGWPEKLVHEAIRKAELDPRWEFVKGKVSHYRHSKKVIGKLREWVKKAISKDIDPRDIIERARRAGYSEDDIVLAFKYTFLSGRYKELKREDFIEKTDSGFELRDEIKEIVEEYKEQNISRQRAHMLLIDAGFDEKTIREIVKRL